MSAPPPHDTAFATFKTSGVLCCPSASTVTTVYGGRTVFVNILKSRFDCRTLSAVRFMPKDHRFLSGFRKKVRISFSGSVVDHEDRKTGVPKLPYDRKQGRIRLIGRDQGDRFSIHRLSPHFLIRIRSPLPSSKCLAGGDRSSLYDDYYADAN